MSEYALLFRGGAAPGSPELTQQRMQKWVAWMKQLGEKGIQSRYSAIDAVVW